MSRVMKSNILINIYPSIFFNFILIIINKKFYLFTQIILDKKCS